MDLKFLLTIKVINPLILYLMQNLLYLPSGVRSMHSTDIQWSAILSWGYADNILRLKSKQSEPPVNFIQSSQFHQVKILVFWSLI